MSTWNKKNFSIYTSDERTALGLIEELGNQTNYNTEELEKVKESDNKKVSHDEMNNIYKIDKNADFTGSWHGIKKPTASQEGLQATVDKIVEDDIPSINEQLDNITQGMYRDDNRVYSLEYILQKQNYLLAQFFQKIRKGEAVKICCQGDSLTYGHDVTSSDVREARADGISENTETSVTQASTTYPEALKKYMNQVFSNIEVTNRGASGQTCQDGFNKWTTTSNSNLTIFMYGTNDSRASWSQYKGDIKQYHKWYEKLIVREILRDSAVIIISPFMETENDMNIDYFRNSLKKLCEKYNVTLIDGVELLRGYDNTIWSDEVHLNGKGYNIVGAEITSILMNKCIDSPNVIKSASIISPNPIQESIIFKNGASYFDNVLSSSAGFISDKGGAIGINNKSIFIPFYCENDNMLVRLEGYIGDNQNVQLILDFEVEQSRYINTSILNKDKFSKPNSKLTLTTPPGNYVGRKYDDSKFIHIAKKGWHNIKIIGNGTNTSVFYALDFLHYDIDKVLLLDNIYKKSPTILENDNLQNGAMLFSTTILYKLANEIALIGKFKNITSDSIVLNVGYNPRVEIIEPVVIMNNDNTISTGYATLSTSGNLTFNGNFTNCRWVSINLRARI